MASKYTVKLGIMIVFATLIMILGASGVTSALINTQNSVIYDWKLNEIPSLAGWTAIASSSDGTKLIAVPGYGQYGYGGTGYIYTSSDSGANWKQQSSTGERSWAGVACSSDGTKFVVADHGSAYDSGGYIWTSADSGDTWTMQAAAGQRYWLAVASSSDGKKLVAAEEYGYIYTSIDSGATWTQQTNAGQRGWQAVASSTDGTKLVAAQNEAPGGGYIYTSTDSGATWTQQTNAGLRQWWAVASSSDGTKLIAADGGADFGAGGCIYLSNDSGATWTQQTSAGQRHWAAVASSSGGTKLAAAEKGGYIYISVDSGVTWTPQTGAFFQQWNSLAVSSDGTRVFAGAGSIWTGSAAPPVVENPTFTAVTTSTATLGATIESKGGSPITAAGIAYGPGANPGIPGNRKTSTATGGAFNVHLTGLTPNTLYHFRGYATNSAGTGYTDDAQFTTVSATPKLRPASNLVSGGFTANWTVPPGTAAIMNYQLDVATDPRFTVPSLVTSYTDLTVSGTSAAVTGLTPGNTYYFRVRAVNDGGTSANSNAVKVVISPSKSLSSQTGVPAGGSLTITNGSFGVSSSGFTYITSGVVFTCVNASVASPYVSVMKVSAGPDLNVIEPVLVELNGSNSINIDKSGASYLWTQLDGPAVTLSNPNAVETSFMAPEAGPEGQSLRFQLAVTETNGAESKDYCIVNVIEDHAPPTANAGPDQTVAWSQIVVLDGSRSSASDAGILSYSWRQASGVPVSLSDASAVQPTFVASNIYSAGESLVFELTVTDRAGLRARDTCIVNVVAGGLPPIANAGQNRPVQPGSTVVLDGAGSKDEGDSIASYTWRQIAGPPVVLSDPTAVNPAFAAPAVNVSTEDLVFELTVTDSAGLQDKARVAITVVDGPTVQGTAK